MENMENRIEKRIYSINKLSYLMANNVNVDLQVQTDSNGHKKVYGVIDEDVTDIIDAYYADKKLHEFLSMFNIIRDRLK